MKTIYSLLLAAVLLPLAAKHDGAYLNRITEEYVTPHYSFQTKPEKRPIRVLFILSRSGARDAVEIVQRMPMKAEYFLTCSPQTFAAEDMYESAMEGTTVFEKERELDRKLNQDYDLYVVGNFTFAKLPEKAQYRILKAVTGGKGLLLVYPRKAARLPYRKLYKQKIAVPELFNHFSQPASGMKLEAWQVGKGRLVALGWNDAQMSLYRTCLPVIAAGNQWKTKQENASAFLGMVCRFAAGRDLAVESPVVRIRDAWNQDVTQQRDLPGGTYYKDELSTTGAFRVTAFHKPSPVGKVKIAVPETTDGKKPFRGSVRLEKTMNEPLVLTVKLADSPFGRVWHQQKIKVPAGASEVPFTIADYYMPTIAGYVRAEVGNSAGKPFAAADHEIFFPDPSLDDYMQLGWDGPNGQNGELLQPQTQGRLGWNLQLTHPSKNGANARILALLNQKMVAYMVRINLNKSKKGGVSQSFRGFLPPNGKKLNLDFHGDECVYRPEIQEIGKKVIAYRIQNLPKYSTAIYSLGDENGVSRGAGYGPSDQVYFRKFLQEKYRTIEALNYNWKSSYASFDDVPHPGLKEAKDAGNYAAWGDHRAYMEKMYADLYAFLRQEIRKYDPGAKVGAEGSVPGDLELTIAPLEYWGPYSSLIGDEALRSFGREKIRMLWWGGYPGSHAGRGRYATPLLRDLLRGTVNGNSWFAANPGSNHSSFGCDLTIAAYVRNYLYDLDRLKNGLAQLLIRNPLADTGVGFYWSHPSSSANLLDPRCGAPNDGLIPLINSAYRTGLGFEFISARTLDRLKTTKTLFLCGGSALSDRECAALLDFVKNGGTLIADMNPAVMNENLRVREKNPLDPLFGNITFDTVPKAQFKPLDLPGLRAARVPVSGQKIMAERKYGKGKAILCNFSFTSASNTASAETPFDGWIMSQLKQTGSAPRFELAGKADDNLLVRIREHRDFALLGVLVPEKQIGRTLDFDLKQNYYIYEADAGFLGKQKKLKFGFDKSPMRLYSLFQTEQKAPDFGIASLRRGEWLKFRLPAPVSGRVFRLELMDPAGKKIWTSVFDRAENAPKRAISYSEPAGQWTAVLTDVATGLSKTIRFEVK